MSDRYTRMILTVIAAALAVLAIEQAIKPAAAVNYGCGTMAAPCAVLIVRPDPVASGRYVVP